MTDTDHLDQAFAIKSGDDHVIEIPVSDRDGNPVDISNAYSITWIIARQEGATPIVTIAKPAITTGGDNGNIAYVPLAEGDTEPLAGVYYWELEIRDNSQRPSTPAAGDINIKRDSIQ